jgi:hypothetical protein
VTSFFVHKRIISAIKRVEFVNDSMSYITLRGRWCDIIVLNVHAPTEDKCDDTKDSFYKELEGVFDQFPKYHIKILKGNFNAKVGREDLFKPTIGNESLHDVACMGEVRGAHILIGRPEGRRPLGRPRHRWEENIKMDLRETGFGYVDWIHMAQDKNMSRALVNTVMNLRVPQNAGNFLTS